MKTPLLSEMMRLLFYKQNFKSLSLSRAVFAFRQLKILTGNKLQRDRLKRFLTLIVAFEIFLTQKSFCIIDPSNQIRQAYTLKAPLKNLKISPQGRFLVFVDEASDELRILDREKDSQIYKIFPPPSQQISYQWIDDGKRLFLRSLEKESSLASPISRLWIYDAHKHYLKELESLAFPTGMPTYFPKDLRVRLLHQNGIISKKLSYSGKRLAKWQKSQFKDLKGFYLVAQKAVLWVSEEGHTLAELKDDGSGIRSWDISPDGQSIVWETASGRLFQSINGKGSLFVDFGRDPSFHPMEQMLVYSGARMLGEKILSYDLKLKNQRGLKVWLTNTQAQDERYPQWIFGSASIFFTKERTNQIFVMDLKE